MGKTVIKFDDTEIEEYKFCQYKIPVSINEIDINKLVVYSFQKQMHIEQIWMKLYVCLL